MSPRVLVAYATNHGHTHRIAERIAERLRGEGLEVDVSELRPRRVQPDPAEYDAVLVGASVHAGKHQRHAVKWAGTHAGALAGRPSAFVSVSLTAADDTDEAPAATRAIVDEFVEQTRWTPGVTATVAGALQYREYDIATRVLMRLIARQHGQSTDAGRDVEFTDWDAVDSFAADFVARVADSAQTSARQT